MPAVRVELYRVSRVTPDALWAVVGDPWRLAGVDRRATRRVGRARALTVGSEIVTVEAGGVRVWRATTVAARLLELTTMLPRGELGVGYRVVRDPFGSRLVLAAGLQTAERGAALRGPLLHAPALRRRLDRWSAAAARVAAAAAG